MKNFRSTKIFALTALGIAMTTLAVTSGCAHKHQRDSVAAALGRGFRPMPPAFMAGPASMLLSNVDGYSAWVTETSQRNGQQKQLAGALVVRGSKFFFEPEAANDKHAVAGQFSYIWDSATGKGFVLSDALQGYAPIDSPDLFTSARIESPRPTAEPVEGYVVERANASVTARDGSSSHFDVSLATDLAGVVVRVRSLDDAIPYSVTLSKVHVQAPPQKLLVPPDDFTPYDSEEALLNEMAAREQGVKHGARPTPEHRDGAEGGMSRPGY